MSRARIAYNGAEVIVMQPPPWENQNTIYGLGKGEGKLTILRIELNEDGTEPKKTMSYDIDFSELGPTFNIFGF